MLKWIAAIIIVLFLGLCTVAYLYSVALRNAGTPSRREAV
jgi:hypothetical protein